MPGRPTNLNSSRTKAYCACSWCNWGLFEYFSLAHHFSFLSLSLSETARYRLKYCLREPKTINQVNVRPSRHYTKKLPTENLVRNIISNGKCY